MTTIAESTGSVRGTDESLAGYAYRRLRDRLVMLDIEPGAPIVESRLASELDVGRTPLREALKRLESDHLVVTYARRGTFATNIDITELAEISAMRHALVPLAARQAASHSGGQVRQQLFESMQIAKDIGENTSRRELLERDLAIHRLINAAAHSPHLQETLVRLDNLVTRIWCVMLERIPPMAEHVQEHAALIRAILDGDPERAEDLALAHVQHFDRVVRSVL